jgi:hypothetical protein
MWEHQCYIDAAYEGSCGLLWHNRVQTPPMFADRAALYQWRDQLGLPRQQAYFMLLEQMEPQAMTLVVGQRPPQIVHDPSQPEETI